MTAVRAMTFLVRFSAEEVSATKLWPCFQRETSIVCIGSKLGAVTNFAAVRTKARGFMPHFEWRKKKPDRFTRSGSLAKTTLAAVAAVFRTFMTMPAAISASPIRSAIAFANDNVARRARRVGDNNARLSDHDRRRGDHL